MKILAVDDDPLIPELLVATLGANGFDDVATAGSADEAAQLISAAPRPFECFLLDIVMPEVDGIELCRGIRSCDLYRATPILMVTATSGMRFITFVGVRGFAESRNFDEVELMINLMIDRLRLTDEAGQPLNIRVAVGAPHPVGRLKSGRVAVALLHRAIKDIPGAPRERQVQGVSGASVLLKALAQVG